MVRGGVPKRSTGSDCKSDGFAFEGSNPSLPTRGHQELDTVGDKSLGSSVVERFLGKEEVGSSTLLSGSRH